MKIIGKVYKCPDNIDTDVIIPAKYLNTSDEKVLALHCLEPFVEQTGKKISAENIIVAGKNFGCGSSREHAPLAIKALGIKCVIAESFARIFFRNAINIGLPVVELKDASKFFVDGEEIEVDLSCGTVKKFSSGELYNFPPFPEFLQKLILAGGLVEFLRESLINGKGI
ncbi:MAG: 3-isopropylmalate dehydratase small subunit [Endomicrobiia bacterium]